MSTLNKVILIGRLGHNPDMKTTDSGLEIANLSIATSDRWKDNAGEWQERTEWHDVVFFGKLAGVCKEYLTKGSSVCIEGSLKTEKYTNKQGQDVYRTKVTGRSLVMLSDNSNNKDHTPQPKTESKPMVDIDPDVEFDDDDLPF